MKRGRHAKKQNIKISSFFIIIIILLILFFLVYYIFFKIESTKMVKIVKEYYRTENLNVDFGKNKVDKNLNFKYAYYINYPEISNKILDNLIKKKKNKIKSSFKKPSFINVINHNINYDIVNYELYSAPEKTFGLIFIKHKLNNKKKIISSSIYTSNYSMDLNEKLKDSYIFNSEYISVLNSYLIKYFKESKYDLKKNYDKIIKKIKPQYIITSKTLNIYYLEKDLLNKGTGIIKIEIPYDDISSVMNMDVHKKNNAKSEKIKKEYKKENKNMYLKKGTYLYKSDSKNSSVLKILKKGDSVKTTLKGQIFSKAIINNVEGYVINDYLSDDIIADFGYIDKKETVYAICDLDIKIKSSSNAVLASIKKGSSITRIGTSDNGFSEVIYDNKKGYIETNKLSISPVNDIPTNRKINPNRPMVALTFDDGPNPSSTGRILSTLSKYNAVATFFDLGKLVYAYPDVVKKEERLGCEVASHTYSHANLNNLSVQGILKEMEQSSNAFKSVLGHDVKLLRPPYGNANDLVKSTVPYPLIEWNIDTLDWKSRNKESILKEFRVTNNYDGKIILMHSIYAQTADAVEVIVPELINKGYQLVTISEMAYYKGVTLKKGQKYYSF